MIVARELNFNPHTCVFVFTYARVRTCTCVLFRPPTPPLALSPTRQKQGKQSSVLLFELLQYILKSFKQEQETFAQNSLQTILP